MKVVLLIDGGHLRNAALSSGINYDVGFIESFAHCCVDKNSGEVLLRVLYYDCPRYRGQQKLPISGKTHSFTASDKWLEDLASRDLFAVRRGTLAFRGWIPKAIPLGKTPTDADFRPNFEQKGVDMRIGLDIASMSAERSVERIILVSADTDMIPAMKLARKSGLQVVGVQLPTPPAFPLVPQFLAHVDYTRQVTLPASAPAPATAAATKTAPVT